MASCSPATCVSDVLIPLFDFRQDDQVGAYETALDRLAERRGEEPADARLEASDWLSGPLESNLEQAGRR